MTIHCNTRYTEFIRIVTRMGDTKIGGTHLDVTADPGFGEGGAQPTTAAKIRKLTIFMTYLVAFVLTIKYDYIIHSRSHLY